MSHNAGHGIASQNEHQAQPLNTLRSSHSHSTLADSIRALREHTSPNHPSIPPSNNSSADSLANRRKVSKPSPLQNQSSQRGNTKLYLRDGFIPPLTPNSAHSFALPSFIDLPTSPRDRIDALLSPTTSPNKDSSGTSSSSTLKAPSYGQLGNTVVPRSIVLGTISPPTSPGHVMQRNLSIDSTVSSISSNNSQAPRSTASPNNQQSNTPDGSFDPAAFVAQVGSVEGALHQLWKEKQNVTSHSAQLWRLVEKQRTMILGLQKDFDRAVKDKERYRKKWKEKDSLTAGPSSSPPVTIRKVAVGSSESPVTRSQTNHGNQAVGGASTNEAIHPPDHRVPTQPKFNDTSPAPTQSKNLIPQTAQLSPLESVSDHTSINTSPITSASGRNEGSTERTQTPLTDLSNITEASPKEADVYLARAEKHRPTNISIINTKAPPSSNETPRNIGPTLAITNPTPTTGKIDPGSFPSPPKASFGGRRSVPAPLTLMQSNLSPTSQQTHFVTASPVIAVRGDHVPDDVDRGRRRTRKDDDLVREAIAIREEEARSQSTKKSISKSATGMPTINTADAPTTVVLEKEVVAIPPSPRLPPNVEQLANTSLRAAVNPASLLSPSGSESSISSTAVQRNSFVPALLSPGLPMSPRPGHRPANSPAPRYLPQRPSVSSVTSGVPGSPDTPESNEDEADISVPSIKPSTPATPPLNAASGRSTGFSSPSAIPAPLFAKKSGSTSPPALSTTTTMVDSKGGVDDTIYQGFMSDQFPGLLLPPNALPLIDVRVFSSRLRPSRHSVLLAKPPQEDDPVFLLGIYSRSDGKQLWRVEKTMIALPSLHNRVTSVSSFTGKLPDQNLFQGHAPAKIDARRAALNAYFGLLLDTPLTEDAALVICHFFSTDAIHPEVDALMAKPILSTTPLAKIDTTMREGYLTKRGKNFGGWKARYFVLEGPELKYYDEQGGPQVGVIRLTNAQIGKQSQGSSNHSPSGRENDANQYRHAFLILEPKKRDSSAIIRHVLCAESDEERDAWVATLLAHVNLKDVKKNRDSSVTKHHPTSSSVSSVGVPTIIQPLNNAQAATSSSKAPKDGSRERPAPTSNNSNKENQEPPKSLLNSILPDRRTPSPQMQNQSHSRSRSDDQGELQTLGVSYEQTVQAEAPTLGQSSYQRRASHLPSKGQTISGPTNGGPIQNMELWGLKTPTHIKDKKRSIFGFRGKQSFDLNTARSDGPVAAAAEPRNPPKNVFGIPLIEAIEYTQPVGVEEYLPAVVYRCIEYLRDKDASSEEGLFRLSGSSVMIKTLRERFNQEGDVRLVDDYFDVHAVASLLKLYLRELPNSILSRDLHLDFLKINDLKMNDPEDHQKKVDICNVLVHRLPRANFSLLDNLCSYLIEVTDKSVVNKMTARNVGIVFAPTLNIPAWLISLFLGDYQAIFGMALDEEKSPMKEISFTPSPISDSIRSPRQQDFSGDLATPGYAQTSFAGVSGFAPLSGQGKAYRMTGPPTQQYQPQSQSFPQPPSQATHGAVQHSPQQTTIGPHSGQQYEAYRPVYHTGPSHAPVYTMPTQNMEASFASLNMLSSQAPLPPQQQASQQYPPSLSVPTNRRNNRESAIIGMDIGLVGQRQPSRGL